MIERRRGGFWRFTKDLLTDPADAYDIVNVLAGVGFCVGLGLQVADYARHWYDAQPPLFSMWDFMKALGAGVAALAFAIRLRDGLPQGTRP